MARRRFSKRAARSSAGFWQRPTGRLTPRVQAVGPEHFGIVSCDCAKARSRYMLTDFYGRLLIEPTSLAHTRGDLQAAIDRIRQARQRHDLRDLVVAIERTGEYHRPVQRAFRQTTWDVRLVHPYATKQYRQPADPGNKTDDTDLAAIFRLTVNGFGLVESVWPADYQQLQLLRRHRRDLVQKTTQLRCQIKEVLHKALPGYADCFPALWESPLVLTIARHFTSAEALRQAGADGLARLASATGLRYRPQTLPKILAWADNAAPGHPQAECLQRIFRSLHDDLGEKERQIQDVERSAAHQLVRLPYVLLLAIPGINVVSSADLAGELGPLEFYRSANAITGRAALMPCRYQSDQVDSHGPLRRCGNRRLRAVLVQIADNLIRHNHHFAARAELWQRAGKDPRWLRVKVAKIFSRVAFALLASRQLFPHPCCQQRHYILDKLLSFHHEHDTPGALVHQDLDAAIGQLPRGLYRQEATPLSQRLDELARQRRGPQPLATILPLVLARLGCQRVQLQPRGARDLS